MFFAVTTLGLEKLAQAEAIEKFPHLSIKIVSGGLEIDAPFEEGLQLNHWLKIPTRILFRLFEAKVRDLPKLYKKFKTYDWRPYYVKSPTVELIHVSASASRLFDDRKISKAVVDGISDFFKATQAKKVDIDRLENKTPPALYLRFENDVLTVSLDTTGERLDRRGVRTWVGIAPLRETYAQACLRAVVKELGEKIKLCDPMAGSGGFIREALDWSLANDQREFSFENIPSFKQLKSECKITNPFAEVIAVESDKKTFKALTHNVSGAKLIHGNSLEKIELPEDLVFISNPPYGIRLKLDNPTAFLNNVVTKLLNHHPRDIALLVPKEIRFEKKHKILLEFSNGGIPVKLVIFQSPPR